MLPIALVLFAIVSGKEKMNTWWATFSLRFSVNGFTADQLRFQQESLASHNSLRARHCVGNLQLDNDLSRTAQAYAEFLANSNKFQHSGNGHGENLYMMSSSAVLSNVPGQFDRFLEKRDRSSSFFPGSKATQSWYDEIKDYNFNAPGFSMATGHFTQVVWKGSTKLGVGIAFANGGRKAVVVANYSPPGNYMGQFPQQVPKIC